MSCQLSSVLRKKEKEKGSAAAVHCGIHEVVKSSWDSFPKLGLNENAIKGCSLSVLFL